MLARNAVLVVPLLAGRRQANRRCHYVFPSILYSRRTPIRIYNLNFIRDYHFQELVSLFQNFARISLVGTPYIITPRSFFCTVAGPILVQAHDLSRLSRELLDAVEDKRLEDAWKLYKESIASEGFLRKSTLSKLIASFAETTDVVWLERAFSIAEMVFKENKGELLEKGIMIYLSFLLAKFGLPVLASTVLRKLIEKEDFVPVNAWSGIIGHMCRMAYGAFLAADIVSEIGHFFKDNRIDPRKKCNQPLLSMKPNITAFNLVLSAGLLFGITKKAEQLLKLMPQTGVKPNSITVIIMAHIYEKNGRIEEIKKVKRFLDEGSDFGDFQFQKYYDCLLSCYLKVGDLSSASEIVLEMLQKEKRVRSSLSAAMLVLEAVQKDNTTYHVQHCNQVNEATESYSSNEPTLLGNPSLSYFRFSNDKDFGHINCEARNLLDDFLAKLQKSADLVISDCGILRPTEKLYAKLVKAFLESNRIKDLADFLVRANKVDSPQSVEKSAIVNVINACISLGWLDHAYDLIDAMHFSGVKLGSSVYSSLLKAYCKENKPREVECLLRDARKVGIQLDSSCYESMIHSRVICKDMPGALNLFREMKGANISRSGHPEFDKLVNGCKEPEEMGLMAKLLMEMREEKPINCGVHEWNNVIHFFCKKRLMQDAHKAFNKMKILGHIPNAQTFHSLATAYAALGGKYTEITELWGEMKVLASSGSVRFDQELLDSLLYSFVRGGFFLRANEVVEIMEEEGFFIDKYKYRILFLKYHKTLYKGKAPKIQTDAQLKRRDAALEFKKWVGLGVK